jgi:hypothetical protein
MVGTGPAGDFSMLARCSVVNHHGNVLYDSYVAPMDKITDYRTKFSGVTPQHLRGGTCTCTCNTVIYMLQKPTTIITFPIRKLPLVVLYYALLNGVHPEEDGHN